MNLKNSDLEPFLFTWKENNKFLILLLYVDDILMTSNDSNKLSEVKGKREKNNRFMPRKIRRQNFEKIGFHGTHPQGTPMITTQVSNREKKSRESNYDNELIEKTLTKKNAPYREAGGSLLYLASATRPDISYAINILSRHQVSPTKNDWAMVKTCGFEIKMFGDSIYWRTHKQSYVVLSTCEAEFVAMSEASQETVSISNSIKLILKSNFLPILWCDNQAAVAYVHRLMGVISCDTWLR